MTTWHAVATSPNGSVWTLRSSPFDATTTGGGPRGVCYVSGLSLWVAVGSAISDSTGAGPLVMTSSDAVTWTSHTTPWDGTGMKPVGVATDGTTVVMLGNGASASPLLSSTNGTTWSTVSSPITGNFLLGPQSITYAAGLWAVAGQLDSSNDVMSSSNLTTWTLAATGNGGRIMAIRYGNSHWVAGGTANSSFSFTCIATSPDLATWTIRSTPFDATNGDVFDVQWNGTVWVAVGDESGGSPPIVMTSPDLATWTARTSPYDSEASASGFGVAWTGSLWAVVAETSSGADTGLLTSPNGTTWLQQANSVGPVFGTMNGAAITYANSLLVAVGVWTPASSGMFAGVNTIRMN